MNKLLPWLLSGLLLISAGGNVWQAREISLVRKDYHWALSERVFWERAFDHLAAVTKASGEMETVHLTAYEFQQTIEAWKHDAVAQIEADYEAMERWQKAHGITPRRFDASSNAFGSK
jgi:hypothetical protein